MSQTTEAATIRDERLELVALAIEATIFAPHELPLPDELHRKYLITAKAAIEAMQKADPRLLTIDMC